MDEWMIGWLNVLIYELQMGAFKIYEYKDILTHKYTDRLIVIQKDKQMDGSME